ADWAAVLPDRALTESSAELDVSDITTELRIAADEWRGAAPGAGIVERTQRALRLVGRALRTAGINPAEIVARDLADLRAKSYLTAYFAARSGGVAT
ncbi:MAG: hypothetical protein IT337_17980, partial [Thermomicrobiales bacterium]|nr:hypothetical protein [Thermomicrobiales bacterium]